MKMSHFHRLVNEPYCVVKTVFSTCYVIKFVKVFCKTQ